MKAPELVAALEREGFAITRRSANLVWLARADQVLLIDEAADVTDSDADRILAAARAGRDEAT